MRRFLITAALCAVAATAQAQSSAQWIGSGNDAIEGCVMSDEKLPTNPTDGVRAGFCLGVVTALIQTEGINGVCGPDGVTNGQAVRVVLRWMQQHPQWLHESFTSIALAALREAWPCQGNDQTLGAPSEPRWRNDFPTQTVPR